MDIIVKFLFYSGKYIIVVTTQSIIEALKRSSHMKTKIMERIDKSCDVIGSHENMLELLNENFESIGSTANIQLAFISDKHKVEFEKYLKDLERSLHGLEINDKLSDITNYGFPFPNHSKMTSNIINQYTIKDVSIQRIVAPASIMKERDCSCLNYSNVKDDEFINFKKDTKELLNYGDCKGSKEQNYVHSKAMEFISNESSSLPISKQDFDEEILINNTENELTEQSLSNRSNSSEMSIELQDSPIISRLFDFDTKALASVIVMNNDNKINYFVKNSITDFCKDLEDNLQGMRNRKARKLMTSTNSKTLMKKLMNNKKDGHMSNRILCNLISRTSQSRDLKNKTSFDANIPIEMTRNIDRHSSLEVDCENTGKLFQQSSESFKIFERRLHDIRIKRSLDEIRNERIREIHNIKSTEEFSDSNEQNLTEKAMKEVLKDLSHNLDITMKKLAANETRFKTLEKKLKQLEQLSISSSTSNMRDLLSEISANEDGAKCIELLNDDVKKIEKGIVVANAHSKSNQLENNKRSILYSQSKKSEIPVPKSTINTPTVQIKRLCDKNDNHFNNKMRTKSMTKLNKNIFTSKKTYFHSIKEIGPYVKSNPTDSVRNYQKDILRLPFKNRSISSSNVEDEKMIDARKLLKNIHSHKLKCKSNLNLNNKSSEAISETNMKIRNTIRRNRSKVNEIVAVALKENVNKTGENKNCNEITPHELDFCKQQDLSRSFDNSACIKHDSIGIKNESDIATDAYYTSVMDVGPLDHQFIDHDIHLQKYEKDPQDKVDVDLIEAKGLNSDQIQNSSVLEKSFSPVQSNEGKIDEYLTELAQEMDAENTLIKSSEESSSEFKDSTEQLSDKLNNSIDVDTVYDLPVTANLKSQKEESHLKSANNINDVRVDNLQDVVIVKDAPSNYINTINSALQNCQTKSRMNIQYSQKDSNSTNNFPVFSTIDLKKYNDSDEPLKYKDAIMSKNIAVKKTSLIKSEKIIIDEYAHDDIKKAKEHIRKKEEYKAMKSEKNIDYEMKATYKNVNQCLERQGHCSSYEFQKAQEHLKCVDKAKAFRFVPIEEVLKNEVVRYCIGNSASPKRNSFLNENNNSPNYEKFCAIENGNMNALEHFRMKHALNLRLSRDNKKNTLNISPTLSWNNNINMNDSLPDQTLPKVIKINSEDKNDDAKHECLSIKDGQDAAQINCITKENENALEAILLNINNIINDKNILNSSMGTRACNKETKESDIANDISKECVVVHDENIISPEEKYKKMCNLLKSIKETIEAHKTRVEQTIRNYEDLFYQNNVDVVSNKQGNIMNDNICHELVDHLNNRNANDENVRQEEDFISSVVQNTNDTTPSSLLVDRENFKTMMSDFTIKHKKNDEFIQNFSKSIENLKRKANCDDFSPNDFDDVQYKSFLKEYSKQFSILSDEINKIAGSISRTEHAGNNEMVAKVNGDKKSLQERSANGQPTEKGMFEEQISKLSIETEKNRCNANKNIPIASTKISTPMLQRENMEIDKMIEANKKAFSELESNLKVVKLIGRNPSVTSLHNLPEESNISPKPKSGDKTIIVLHESNKNKSNQCQMETVLVSENISGSSITVNDSHEPKACPSDSNKSQSTKNTSISMLVKEDGNSDMQVLTNNDDSIIMKRKGSDKEFQRDKHTSHAFLKQHEVKKKEYHTRCRNISTDSKNENEENSDIPTELLVTNNTEIPIQMLPMIDVNILLNNFNIDKSLIHFEEPHKELLSLGGEIGCKENYLKESITENVLFKKLINLEEVKKFFRINERKTSAGNEEKHTIEENIALTDLKKDEQKSFLEAGAIADNIPMKKTSYNTLKIHTLIGNKANAEANIKKIKEQSLRKRHIEKKVIDTRTQKEIEKSIITYKQKFGKKRHVKVPKYINEKQGVKNSQEIINQLEDFISKTDFLNNSNSDSVQSNKKSEVDLVTNHSIVESDPSEQDWKMNSLHTKKQHPLLEGDMKKTELQLMASTEQANITQNEIIEAVTHIKEILQRAENSDKTGNNLKTIINVNKEDNLIKKENRSVQVAENEIPTTQSYIQDITPNNLALNRNFNEKKDVRNEELSDYDDSIGTINKEKSYRMNTPNLYQNNNKNSQPQEEFIYIEPTQIERNSNNVGMFPIEDIADRKEKVSGRTERTKYIDPTVRLENINSKKDSKTVNSKRYSEYINPTHRLQHMEPKLTKSNSQISGIKYDYDTSSHGQTGDNAQVKKYHVLGVKKEFKPRSSSVPPTNEQFLDVSNDDNNKFSDFVEVQNSMVRNNKTNKSTKSRNGAFKDRRRLSVASDLINKKSENMRKMKNRLKSIEAINMNSAKLRKKFENIYEQIEKFNKKHLEKHSQNLELQEESDSNDDFSTDVFKAVPNNMELYNQNNILPLKTMWNQDKKGSKNLWKRLQHVKKIANEKSSEKSYMLGTKLPTLKMNNLPPPRLSEKLLPVKKPKQYEYQVKKVKVGDRIMNITYLVEAKESRL